MSTLVNMKPLTILLFLAITINTGLFSQVTASDCPDAINVCTDLNFTIDPNGEGVLDEIPSSGTFGNPYDNNPGGSGNDGCLWYGEYNSTWMIVNIAAGGDLEFTFGGNGTQIGFYDWIMYPYDSTSCDDIPNNLVAPVRCNFNLVDTGGTGLSDMTAAGGNAGNFEPSFPVLTGDRYVICFSNYDSQTTSVPLEFGGTAVVSCSPVPVDFLSLNITCNKITWSTAAEINNDYFTIYYSNNAWDWEEYAIVNGNGNTNVMSYYSLGFNGLSGYYKLTQTDYDGQTEDLTVGSIYCDTETKKVKAIYGADGKFFGVKMPNTSGLYIVKYEDGSVEKKNIIKH